MTHQSEIGTAPLPEPPPDRNRRKSILTLGVGIVIGILLSLIVTVILFNAGFFDQFYVCPAPVSVEACPPNELIACPTFMPAPTDEAKSLDLTPTPTFTATPDIGATATAACGSFESQFPGTPCPDDSNP